MKNHYRFLGLALLVPVLAIANFNEEPVPVQSFQQAQSTAPETTDVPKNAVKAPENGPEGITGIEDLKAELNQLNQNDLQFEQKTNDKLNDLLNKKRAHPAKAESALSRIVDIESRGQSAQRIEQKRE